MSKSMEFTPKYSVEGVRKFHDELHSYPESVSRSECMVCCCLQRITVLEESMSRQSQKIDTVKY